ncbi:MAG: phosphoribosyltransferase [Candidatus Bathyarchaeota archaeon]|nr:phosphoribosyltransferase [Candidatus Bathyarchaeum sp.]
MKEQSNKKQLSYTREKLEFEIPSWNQIYTLLLKIAEAVKKSKYEPDIIVGVSRGGWIPARIMVDLLENPKLANVATEYYLGVADTKQEPTITQPISISVEDKKVLVVDDVADTGESLKLVNTHLKEHGASEIRIATIYYKQWSVTVPQYYAKETCLWIIFPWEQKEAVKKVVEKFGAEGITEEDAKEKLISSGLDKELVERFIKEAAEEEQ